MVKNKKNKKNKPLPLSLSIIGFLYSWILFFGVSFKLFNILIKLIKFPTAFGLFMFPILCAGGFIILLVTLYFANQIKFGFRRLKIIKKLKDR